MSVAIDASALLALLFAEPGAELVADAIAGGAVTSAVNLSEVATVLVRHKQDPADDSRSCPRAAGSGVVHGRGCDGGRGALSEDDTQGPVPRRPLLPRARAATRHPGNDGRARLG